MTTILDTTPEIEAKPDDDAKIVSFSSVPITPEEVDWAEGNLAGLPTHITFPTVDSRAVRIWQTTDGSWWRQAGHIVATLETRFRICLYRGATEADLEWLQWVIRAAQVGALERFGWKPNPKVSDSWIWNMSRPVGGPEAPVSIDFVVACEETGCQSFGKYHTTDSLDEPFFIHYGPTIGQDDGEHWVLLQKWTEWEEWRVVVADGEYVLDQAEAAGFISDLQWAATEAKKLNAA